MHHGKPAREDESTVIPLRGRGLPETAVAEVDLDDLNSPHTLAVLSVPPGSAVLDIGCGPGVVARALAARGCKVWGLEVDPRRARSARQYCVEVLEADIEAVSLSEEFAGRAFDAVLFLDVLEHLRDPQAALAKAASVLAPGGRVLMSIPNITHGALRLELLSGRFRYRPSGLLDRGHLRFFDAEAVDELVRQAGFSAETRLRVTRRLDQTEFDVDLAGLPAGLVGTLERDADALTYQFFVIARPASEAEAAGQGITLVERQRARIDELTAAIEEGATYGRHLHEELAARDARLREIEGVDASRERAKFEQLAAAVERGGAYALHLQGELDATAARLRQVEGAFADAARQLEAKTARLAQIERAFEDNERELEREATRLREVESAFAGAERELKAKTLRLGDVERAFHDLEHARETDATHRRQVEGALAAARGELDSNTAAMAELEQLVADLKRIAEDNASYVRHLEGELRKRAGDVAIRDDEISVLRIHIEKVERVLGTRDAALGERDRELAEREAALATLRARLDDMGSVLADRDQLRASLEDAQRALADRDALLEASERQLAESRRHAAELSDRLRQPRHRLAERGNDRLKRWVPFLHRVVRPLVAAPPPDPPDEPCSKLHRGAD